MTMYSEEKSIVEHAVKQGSDMDNSVRVGMFSRVKDVTVAEDRETREESRLKHHNF